MTPLHPQDDPAGIVFLIESLGSGGAEGKLVELATRLDRDRFSPRFVVWQEGGFYEAELQSAKVPVHRLIRRSRLDLRVAFMTARLLRSGEARIVAGCLGTGNLYAALSGRLAGRGVVVASENSQGRQLEWPRKALKVWAHRSSDVTVCNSAAGETSLRELVQASGLRTVMIPNGVDMDRFRPEGPAERLRLRRQLGWNDEETVFLTVGRIEPVKNHLLLGEAFRALQGTPRWRACWIGEASGEHARAVRASIARSALAGRIDIRPAMGDIEMAYKACDILVLPSTREGTSNAVLEAMACSRPVVATDVGDVGRYVEDQVTGWLVPPGDVASLGRSLVAALRSTEELRRIMGEMGCEKLGRLGMDVETMVRRHESLYEELLGSGTWA